MRALWIDSGRFRLWQVTCPFSQDHSRVSGYDEPEILRYENMKSVPQALTLDTATRGARIGQEMRLRRRYAETTIT